MNIFKQLKCDMLRCQSPVKYYVVYSSEYICGECKEITYSDHEVKPLAVPQEINCSLQIVECNIETIELLLVHKPTLQYKWEHLMESFKDFKVRATELREAFQNLITKKFWSKMEDIKPQIEQLKQEWKQSPILTEMLLFKNSESIRLRVKGIDEQDSALNQNICLKATLDEVRRERLQVETDLNTKIERLSKHNSEINSQRDQLQEELDSTKHRAEQLETQKIQLTTELCKAETQTEEKQARIEDMKTNYAALKTNYEDLKTEISNKIDELNESQSHANKNIQKSYKRIEEQDSDFHQIVFENLENMGMDLDWIKVTQTTNQKESLEKLEEIFEDDNDSESSEESEGIKQKLESIKEAITKGNSHLTRMLTKAYVQTYPSLKEFTNPESIEFLEKIASHDQIWIEFGPNGDQKVFKAMDKRFVSHLKEIELFFIDEIEVDAVTNFLQNCIPDYLEGLTLWGSDDSTSITPYLDSILNLKEKIWWEINFNCFTITAKEKKLIDETFGWIEVRYGMCNRRLIMFSCEICCCGFEIKKIIAR
ncbi:unnamed protein product [Moneuplotes crassus]|uniref:Uncharacterized protein n=1 Tax=Euplotes crassus TaxID=5936 RepID=A0AAD1X6T2_EUPCR|nr:unnamed protein product [Moneuplotes crassus]